MLDIASPLGGDVEKIGNFQSGKSRSHGTIFLYHLLGAMMRKLTIFIAGKYARIVPSFWHLLLGGDVEKIDHFQRWENTFTWQHFQMAILIFKEN